ASMYRQDVLANNLANVDTIGFKPDTTSTRLRDSARTEDGLTSLPSNPLLERLGAGVLMSPNRVSMAQGSPETTGDPLSVAIMGEGFLAVDRGGNGGDRIRLTRDGKMTLDAQGRLVVASTGLPVLDTADQPITLRTSSNVQIAPDGTISQGGTTVAKLQLTT